MFRHDHARDDVAANFGSAVKELDRKLSGLARMLHLFSTCNLKRLPECASRFLAGNSGPSCVDAPCGYYPIMANASLMELSDALRPLPDARPAGRIRHRESACKRIVGSRLKGAGRCWSKAGANAVLATGCCLENMRWPGFLEWRACRLAVA